MFVEKQVFELASYTTEGGATIRDVRVGWESYGRLNAKRSNAILVTHYFSGTSHAAGRYRPDDPLPGYWDSLIGPGKAIDTDRWFVLSSDTLVNLNANDPYVTTTGPASIDPGTGKPYGLTFPVVSIRDFVRVQKALLDHLGIPRLAAVAGPSMGGLQAYEWAVSYPDMVERIIPVIAAAGGDPFLIAWVEAWGRPIRLDPHWNGGDYYGRTPPTAGVTAALELVTLHANQSDWARTFYGKAPAEEGRSPAEALPHAFKVVRAVEELAAARAAMVDANTFLYLVRANQLAGADPSRIKAPTLIVYEPTDLVFPQPWIERTAAAIRGNGTEVETFALQGPNGHLNGVLYVAQAGEAIRRFLG